MKAEVWGAHTTLVLSPCSAQTTCVQQQLPGLIRPGHWGAEVNQLPLPHPAAKRCLPRDGTPHPGWAGHAARRQHPAGSQQQCTPLLTPTPSYDTHMHQDTEQGAWQGQGQCHRFSSAGAHTHTCIHAHMHTRIRRTVNAAARCSSSTMPARPREGTHTCTHSHAHRCTHTKIYMQIYTHRYMHTHIPVCNYTYMQMQTLPLVLPWRSSCTLPSSCKSSLCKAAPCKSPTQVPKAMQMAVQGQGVGYSTTQHRQQHPHAPRPLPGGHSPWHWHRL